MMEREMVPLALVDALGVVKGKTRFQKLLYLYQSDSRQSRDAKNHFPFELYHYGPFSFELESTLDILAGMSLLKVTTSLTPEGHSLYLYQLTREGRQLLRQGRNLGWLSRKTESGLRTVAENYGGMPLRQLVDEAYGRYEKTGR